MKYIYIYIYIYSTKRQRNDKGITILLFEAPSKCGTDLSTTCRLGTADLIALRLCAGFIDLFGIEEVGLTNKL
jgi:hypothetical protein